MAAECDALRFQLLNSAREKERDASIINSLRQEVSVANSRVGSLQVEHRDLRNQWLNERSELENKSFQMQALTTTIQGMK